MGETLLVEVNYDKKTKIHECNRKHSEKWTPKNEKWIPKKRKGNRAKEADRNVDAKEYPYFQRDIGRATEHKRIYHKAEMKALGYEWVGHFANGYRKKHDESK